MNRIKWFILLFGAIALLLVAIRFTYNDAFAKGGDNGFFSRISESSKAGKISSGKKALGIVNTPPKPVQLSGIVRGADGKPLAHATVCASCAACNYRLTREVPTCVQTDEDGHYLIEGLPYGKYRISAAAKNHAPKVLNRGKIIEVDKEGLSKSDLDSELDEGGAQINGMVNDVTGGPVAGAVVRATYFDGDISQGRYVTQATTSDEEGGFALSVAPGMVDLIATAEGYAPGTISRIAPTNNVKIIVTPSSSISGIVVAADESRPVANAKVHANGRLAGEQFSTSDDSGRFVIQGLRPGTYYLSATAEGWMGAYPKTVVLDIADTVEDVVLPVQRAVSVRGRLVVGGNETPCTMGEVNLFPPAMDGSLPALKARSDSDGYVVFEAVPSGVYLSRIRCADLSPQEAQKLVVGDKDLSDLVWKVESLLTITGRVVGPSGTPFDNVHVQVTPAQQPGTDPMSIMASPYVQAKLTDAKGRFDFKGIPAGIYSIETRYLEEPVQVELNEKNSPLQVTLRVDPMGYIEVRASDPQGEPVDDLMVSATSIDGTRGGHGAKLGGGRFRIGPLPIGTYRIEARDGINPTVQGKGKYETVEVSADKTSEAEIVFGGYQGRIAGRVINRPDIPVANVWVQAIPANHSEDPYFVSADMIIKFESRRALSGLDGRFEITGLAESGTFTLAVEYALGGQTRIENVKSGQDVEIVLEPQGSLSGIVVDTHDEPVTRFGLYVHNRDTGEKRTEKLTHHPDGKWSLSKVTPGQVEVTAYDYRMVNRGSLSTKLLPDQKLEGLRVVLSSKPNPYSKE